jgi:uncharacterized protein YndB with AHSA1/START domain
MAKIIQHQLFYPNPPQDVWDYLTDPELMVQWLMPSDFLPILGHEFQFKTKANPDIDFDGIFFCKVLEITPLKTLSYSWKFGPGDGTLTDSVVSWTLNEKDNGTELQLIHRGLAGSETMTIFTMMDEGWLKNMQKILKLLNTTTDGTTPA